MPKRSYQGKDAEDPATYLCLAILNQAKRDEAALYYDIIRTIRQQDIPLTPSNVAHEVASYILRNN